MSLDYGYGTDDERELAEAADDQAETAFRVLHGLTDPYEVPGQALVATDGPDCGRKAKRAGLAGSTDSGEKPSVVTSATPLSDSGPVPVLSPSWVPASAGACESTTPEEEAA